MPGQLQSHVGKKAAVLKKFLSSLPEVFQTSLETLSTIQTLKMTCRVILDDWTCDWHSQASGIAFQTFVQTRWCSSKHLCPLLSLLGELEVLEDMYWKTPRTRRAMKTQKIISATILNLDPTLWDRGLRKNMKLFFQNCLERQRPLRSCYRTSHAN